MTLFWSVLAAGLLATACASNPRPVVGILVQPLQPDVARDQPLLRYGSMYCPASYVKQVEAAGARAAPVFYNSSASELRALFGQLSGLLLPGGHVSTRNTTYASAVYSLLDLAASATGFPVHGTCMGSQQMAQWASGQFEQSVLSVTDAEDLLLPLAPTSKWSESWLLDGMPDAARAALTDTNSTVNLHGYGVPPSKFDTGAQLDTGVLRPLATSVGSDGVEFVALYEGVPPLSWSASQYHPEKNAFEFGGQYQNDPSIDDVHSDAAIEASFYLMRKLVAAARSVKHAWNESGASPLMREFAPVPGGPDAGFDWESCYFW